MTEQIIDDPRASEIAQAFKDGDEVQALSENGEWFSVYQYLFYDHIDKPMRIVKKPKIVLSAYGFDFTAEELPLAAIDKDELFFFVDNFGEISSSKFDAGHRCDAEKLKSRQAFSSPEAAEKWHAMTQAFYDDVLKGVKHD